VHRLYTDHKGWIAIHADDDVRWDEVASLVFESYRHFELKRMLKAVDVD